MQIVYDTDKLTQDLSLWLLERYGVDRFHPALGSTLENYIGSVINSTTQVTVQNEIMRVLDNYTRVQKQGFDANPQLYSLAELLYSINSVTASIGYDSVSAQVNVTSAQGQQIALTANQSV